jgi:HTH-type transcriptional regulator/antitoxin HipB
MAARKDGCDMSRHRKPALAAAAEHRNREQLGRLGRELRASRTRRRITQAQLGARVGLSQSTISELERGEGGSLSLDTLQRVAGALGRNLGIDLGRDAAAEPADAGHLAIQELALRLGRAVGYEGTFELAGARPGSPYSTDVGLVSRKMGRLLLIECVNTFGDVGASVRSSDRKRQEALEYAIALGGERALDVHTCWIVRATRRNRDLVARYPELFSARFPGSSAGWVRALTLGERPPSAAGLVWCDITATRVFARRGR